jgi:uncharacterized SAM-binding protein YcdF (DUF218 family)
MTVLLERPFVLAILLSMEFMKTKPGRGRWWWLALALLGVVSLGLASKAAAFLVVDAPRASDVILVLAGETDRRPERARQLLAQGFGRRIVLDVPTNAKIYEFTQIQLAQKYIQGLPQPALATICPIAGLSTKDEAKDAGKCLAGVGGKSVLIVTSDFHARRALSVFRRELPEHEYSAAAARNEEQFGARWWTHRQWAKTFADEWLRFIWWKMVDQWF